MKPDSYMEFYGPAFMQAVKGQPDAVVVAYLTALVYYWFHNNCRGLQDDTEFLRRVCERDKDEWPKIREVVFDNDQYFTQEPLSGLWHQKKAKGLWKKAEKGYQFQVDRTAAARAARWAKRGSRGAR